METIWFKVEAGGRRLAEVDGAIAELHGRPDRVRLPADLGGAVALVLGEFVGSCPVCTVPHPVRVLDLEGGISSVECEARGFVWVRTSDLVEGGGEPGRVAGDAASLEVLGAVEGSEDDLFGRPGEDGPFEAREDDDLDGPEDEGENALADSLRPGERPRFDDPFDEAWYDLDRERGKDLGAKD